MAIARVALDVPLPRLFDYLTPEPLPSGTSVVVPFGGRRRVGIVVEDAAQSEVPGEKLKPVERVLRDRPTIPADCMALAKFCSAYYQRPLGEVLVGALPPRLRRGDPLERRPTAFRLTDAGRDALAAPARASLKRTVMTHLAATGQATAVSIAALGEAAPAQLRVLERSGWIEAAPVEIPRDVPFAAEYELTPEQTAAIEAVGARFDQFAPHLLLGITGSGKTEVYMHLVRATLARERQALVLVPEISLTPQLAASFSRRFPGVRIAVLHSALADNERALAWLDAASGEARIVLGTRLAVFAPFAALGLVVVDEEHDASFKQQDGVRYSARDLAVVRASTLGIPIVLGSATPSLESYANADSGRYTLLRLPARARAGSRLPQVHILDTRYGPVAEGIADPLLAAIESRMARKEQSLVFLNRRGYAPVLGCGACGWVGDCRRCAAHLVVHLKDKRLRCHHCGDDIPIPRGCPSCGNVDLVPFGRGTQRIEDAIAARLPEARVLRIDSDSMRGKGRWEAMIDRIRAGDVDVLVGTQILAKGHDFPRLTLVGILGADAALMAADYRAPERLFAQLQQVAGRAGRAELRGEVMIQTRYPTHPLYRALVNGDYEAFARVQLGERTAAGFPPSVSEAVLRAEAREIEDALGFLGRAVTDAPAPPADVTVFDPVEMSLARLAGWARAHVLVQSPSRRSLQTHLASWSARLYATRAPADVRWHFDVDPIEF